MTTATHHHRRKSPVRLFGLIAGVLLCGLMLVAAPEVQAQEVTAFGNGAVPAGGGGVMYVFTTVNDTPVANFFTPNTVFTPNAYTMTSVTIPGAPGVITYQVEMIEYRGFDTTVHADITMTYDMASGAITITGTGSGIVGTATATGFSGGGSVATAGNAFTLTTTDVVTDNNVAGCIEFSGSVVRVCLTSFIQLEDPRQPPVNDPDGDGDGQPDTPEVDAAEAAGERDEYIQEYWVRALQEMANQLSHVMIQQVQMIGVLLDAKNQLEVQRLFGEGRARSQREYQPSQQVCVFGTLARITAPSRFNVSANTNALNTILQKRELLNAYVSSAWGPFADIQSRQEKFTRLYCDNNDNNGVMPAPEFCNSGASTRKNLDINYTTLIDRTQTLDINFTDNVATPVEEDVLALAKNLYSHQTFTAIPERSLGPWGSLEVLMNMRNITAIRGVARNSFATIAGMKAQSQVAGPPQLRQAMVNLGVPEAQIDALIGANPSYFAQMDIMTQKVFQNPSFFSNLYESPANVARTGVVMQAVRLTSDQDKLEAALRREMLLSLWLEMRLREKQREENNTNYSGSRSD